MIHEELHPFALPGLSADCLELEVLAFAVASHKKYLVRWFRIHPDDFAAASSRRFYGIPAAATCFAAATSMDFVFVPIPEPFAI